MLRLPIGISVGGTFLGPLNQFLVVCQNANALPVSRCDLFLGFEMILLRGLQVISKGLGVILGSAPAVFAENSQVEQGIRISLFRGFPEPEEGFLVVFLHAEAVGIKISEKPLRDIVALVCQRLVQRPGEVIVF